MYHIFYTDPSKYKLTIMHLRIEYTNNYIITEL